MEPDEYMAYDILRMLPNWKPRDRLESDKEEVLNRMALFLLLKGAITKKRFHELVYTK